MIGEFIVRSKRVDLSILRKMLRPQSAAKHYGIRSRLEWTTGDGAPQIYVEQVLSVFDHFLMCTVSWNVRFDSK